MDTHSKPEKAQEPIAKADPQGKETAEPDVRTNDRESEEKPKKLSEVVSQGKSTSEQVDKPKIQIMDVGLLRRRRFVSNPPTLDAFEENYSLSKALFAELRRMLRSKLFAVRRERRLLTFAYLVVSSISLLLLTVLGVPNVITLNIILLFLLINALLSFFGMNPATILVHRAFIPMIKCEYCDSPLKTVSMITCECGFKLSQERHIFSPCPNPACKRLIGFVNCPKCESSILLY